MSIRIPCGMTLTQALSKSKAQHEWISKLHGNTRSKLDRLGEIVALAPESLKVQTGMLILYWTGKQDDLKRITKVLGMTFVTNGGHLLISTEAVKFSRISLKVMLLEREVAVQHMRQEVAKKKAA